MSEKSKGRGGRGRVVTVILVIAFLIGCAGLLMALRNRYSATGKLARGRIYMSRGKIDDAMREYQGVLKRYPDQLWIRRELVSGLIAHNEFDKALAELDEEAKYGMSHDQLVADKATVTRARANRRLASEGAKVTVERATTVLNEELVPAVESVRNEIAAAAKPSDILWTALGDLYAAERNLYETARYLTQRDVAVAQDSGDKEKTFQLRGDLDRFTRQSKVAREEAIKAYMKAIETNPNTVEARISAAEQHASAYYPELDDARTLIAPLMKLTPVPSRALRISYFIDRDKGETEKALQDVEAYLKTSPRDSEFLAFKVELLLQANRADAAEKTVNELAMLRPSDALTQYLLGRVLMAKNEPKEASTHLQIIFAGNRPPWPQARLLLAQSLIMQGSMEQGVSNMRRVVDEAEQIISANARDRQSVREAAYTAAVALADREDIIGLVEARKCAAEAFSIFPDRPKAYDKLMELSRKAETPVDQMEIIAANHAAAMGIQPQERAAAIKVCDDWIASAPEEAKGLRRVRSLRARLLAAEGRYSEALEALQKLWREDPKDTQTADNVAAVQRILGKNEDLLNTYATIYQNDKTNYRALVNLIILNVRMGKAEQAKALIEDCRRSFGDESVRQLMTGIYVTEGNLDDAVKLAQDQAQSRPESTSAHIILAELLRRKGDLAESRKEYDETLKLDPRYRPGYLRVYVDLQMDKAADALALMKQAESQYPDDITARTVEAVSLQALGRADEGIQILTDISAKNQGTAATMDVARLLLAMMYAAKGDIENASRCNEQIKGKQDGWPSDRLRLIQAIIELPEADRAKAALAANLAVTYDSGKSEDACLAEARKIRQLLPSDPMPEFWAATAMDKLEKRDEAVAMYRALIAAHPEFLPARISLAESLASRGRNDEAVIEMRAALESADPDSSARISMRLGELYESLSQFDDAIAAFQSAAANAGLAPLALNAIAWLTATRMHDPFAAAPVAEKANSLAPKNTAIMDTLGWIQYLTGENNKALINLKAAREGLQRNPTVRYHYGMALLKAGRNAEARSELQDALTISEEFPEADAAASALSSIPAQ